ncbi:tyrosine-type recombinase/integrase [Mesorhizobium sp. Z1-4]|uniref:tyrosine-type recombinase/integrase n=1 Tax=Mesorhizobium sp. Z1-4 TaxID=2448478 RepID=UPI000FDBE4EA|nr:tyrosine-type recombinase/integrase [Mesorhizobium sp. Z1-4]
MIDLMPRKLPPFVQRERTRHGKVVFYFRRGTGKRTRLPTITDPAFQPAYEAALRGAQPKPAYRLSPPQSLRWLIERYMESADWRSLSSATRRQRSHIFVQSIDTSKNVAFAEIASSTIERAMDKRAETPAQANNFLKAMRGLFAWALRNNHVAVDPTVGVKRIRYRSTGFAQWSMSDVEKFRACHSVGSRARLAMELLLHTGLRRSDIVLVGRQHLRGDILSVRTYKTGTQVTLRLAPWLLDLIEQTATGDMHFLVSDSGAPYTVESFGNWFRDRCRDAKVQKSAHGLRKLAATIAADAGATAHDLMSMFGWVNIKEAELYTKGADRARLGIAASERIANAIPRTDIPPSPHRVRKQ